MNGEMMLPILPKNDEIPTERDLAAVGNISGEYANIVSKAMVSAVLLINEITTNTRLLLFPPKLVIKDKLAFKKCYILRSNIAFVMKPTLVTNMLNM